MNNDFKLIIQVDRFNYKEALKFCLSVSLGKGVSTIRWHEKGFRSSPKDHEINGFQ